MPRFHSYQFGVFTGTGLKKIADHVKTRGHIWGFDSFKGIPPETEEENDNWRHPKTGKLKAHFLEGGYSAAHALNTTSLRSVLRFVAAHVGHRKDVTLVPGFFNDSLNDGLLRRHALRPALHVDMDADIYLSAIQSLDWMFAHRLIVPSTFLRYDDWPRVNASYGPAKGSNFFGQCRAHYELSVKYDVRWKLVAKNTVQVLSIGTNRCPPEVCDKATSMRSLFHEPPGTQVLFPMWGLPTERAGLY
jgi:hypothetical protein